MPLLKPATKGAGQERVTQSKPPVPLAHSTGTVTHPVMELEPKSSVTWLRSAEQLQIEAHAFYFAFKHPRVPWYARLVAVITAGYLFSPIQLIPSFIPVIGFLDDLLVLILGARLLKRIIPADVLRDCRELAEAAGKRRKEAIRSRAAIIGFAVIVVLWLLGAIAASAALGCLVLR